MKKLVLKLTGVFVLVFTITFISLNLLQNNKTNVSATSNTTPSLEILKNNVSYSESIYIAYAVAYDGFEVNKYDVSLLFWNSSQETYLKGTETAVGTSKGKIPIDSKQCLVFYSEGLAAKNMTDDLIARAYVKIGETEYYSEPVKFSVLEYVYKMKEESPLTYYQEILFDSMLNYGGAAQNNFEYNTDRPANGTYYNIKVNSAYLPDGFNHGRYKPGDKVVIKPLTINGQKFSHWIDQNGVIVSYNKEFEVEVNCPNEFTPIYKDITNVSSQLKMEYEVTYDATSEDLDLPNAVSFEVDEEVTTLEITWDLTQFKQNQIGVQKLYATLVDENAYIEYGINKEDIYCEVNVLPYTYELDQTTGLYTLTGYYGTDEVVEIPSLYKNTYITKIGSKAFNEIDSLKEVIIPISIEEISYSAFYYCDNLEKMTLPFIGRSAEDYQNSSYSYFGYIFGATSYENQKDLIPLKLTSIALTEGGKYIGEGAFYNLEQITDFIIPNSLEYIGYAAFLNCSSLTSFNINSNLKCVNLDAFNGCDNLKKVYADNLDSLFEISSGSWWGGSMFFTPLQNDAELYVNNELVTELVIPSYVEDVTRIFAGCSSIEKIYISKSVKSFDASFYWMKNLKEVIFEEGSTITKISQDAFFNCQNLVSINIPSTVTEIQHRAFSHCPSLTDIILPEGLVHIATDVFQGCSSLTNINLPTTLQKIEYGAFRGCDSLESIALPKGITVIENGTFAHCYSLKNVILPITLTTIEESAFDNCLSLQSIEIPSRVRSIGYGAFQSCDGLYFIKNNSDLDITFGSNDNGCIGLYAKEITDKNGNLQILDGYTYDLTDDGFYFEINNDEYTLVAYLGNEDVITLPLTYNEKSYKLYKFKSFNHVIIPEGFTEINDYAFENSYGIKSITIPSTVNKIGAFAFSNCVAEIIWENPSIEIIGDCSFYKYLGTNLTIPSSVTKIGNSAFVNCYNLKSIVLPDSIVEISYYAFESCGNLTKIYIPSSVNYIDMYAFYNCYNLTIYCETESEPISWDEQWNINNLPVIWGYSILEEN